MATIDPVVVKIQADVADLKSGLEKAEASLKGLDDSVKKADSGFAAFTTRMKQLGATIGVTFAASQVVSFFKESVAAAQEAEAAQARLATLLRNTNGATEAQIVALGNQAKALEKVGVVSADNITVAQSQLATFDLSAGAIGKLTPAILNYVTAEKGATASADDFKAMTNSLALALNGQYGSLSRVGFPLTDMQKKMLSTGTEMERATALTEILNSTYNDFNIKLRETSEGLAQVAKNDLNNLKQEIGKGLQPIIDNFNKFLIDTLIPTIRKFGKFLIDNKDTIIAVTKVLAGGAAAFAIYKTAIAAATAVTKVYQVTMVLMRGQQLATIASTNTLAASMLRLNAIIRANPIGALITVVTLAVSAVVALWKNSETFRKIVIAVGKAGLQAFAAIVPMVAQVFEAIMKVSTGPLRLLLTGLSKLPGVGKYAKAGLDAMNTGLNSISDLGVKAAAKATELSKKLDGLAKSAKKAGEETENAVSGKGGFGKGRKGDGGGLDEKTQKKVDSLKDKLTDYYKSWEEAQADAQDKFAEGQERFNERVADAQQTYLEREKDITERYNDQMAEAQERYDETVATAKERAFERETELRTNHAKKLIDINKRFAKQEADAKEQLEKRITELQENAQQKRLDLRRSAADKEASLIKQSVDRLRSAFASALGFSLKEEFEKSGGVAGILEAIRTKLKEAADLQKNAAALAGKGYSQTFIEQILQAGPKIGNDMAKALLEATPETTAEMQALFGQLETVQDTGLDILARSMNEGGNLATRELREQYQNVAKDLTESLAEVDAQLKLGLQESQQAYNNAMAETAKLRQEAIDEAIADLNEALAENDKILKEALAKAEKALKDSQDKAKKDRDKALTDAQEALQKALIDAQKAFDKTIDDINKSMEKKLNDLLNKIRETAAAIAALGGATPNFEIPSYTPFVSPTPSVADNSSTTNNNNITIIQNTQSNPIDTSNSVLSAIKFGNVIVPTAPTKLAAGESGAIGAASIRSRTTLDPSYIAMRAR
jgi:hypothetical protein